MLKRIFIYLKEMYPFASWLGTFLSGFMVLTVVWRLKGNGQFDWWTLRACFALCFFSLLLRVMDEFKDYQDDLKNFPERPLPSGKVKQSDLKVLGWFCVVAGLALSFWEVHVVGYALVVLLFSYLMLKWFFREAEIRASLPLALVTHHPIVLLHFAYLFVVAQTMEPEASNELAYVVMPLALMMTNWEITRKIRAPGAETSYTTYSKIWGARKASLIALGLQLVVMLDASYILHNMDVKWGWITLYVAVYCGLMLPTLAFAHDLAAKKPLKTWAELQVLWNVIYLLCAGWFL